ncbi:MAG: MGMT family protein [Anaerolineales bacterium]
MRANERPLAGAGLHARIQAVVRQIPPGRVATYGQVADIVGGCSAQMVGFAMAALPGGSDAPWQRVINRQGKISPRGADRSGARQRALLEAEGVRFDADSIVDFAKFGWGGPDEAWACANGFMTPPPPWARKPKSRT